MGNLSILSSLLRLDFISFVRWWRRRALSNFFISLSFFGLFSLISLFIYFGSYSYLLPLTRYQSFGEQTALYLVHVSIIITLWLGIAGSFIGNLNFLLSTNLGLDYLITLPIKSFIFIFHSFLKSIFSSLLWSLFIFLPLGLVTLRLFGTGANLIGIINLLLVITLVIISAVIIGTTLSFLYGRFLHSLHSPYITFGLTLAFIFSTVFLIRLILPPSLASLISVPIERFNDVFSALPLNRVFIPTLYLTNLLFAQNPFFGLLILGILLLISYFLIYFSGGEFIYIRQNYSSINTYRRNKAGNYADMSFIKKDIFSVLRKPSEAGYGLFLLGLIAGFFYFFFTNPRQSSSSGLAWFLFYSLAYFLRLVFPLMAKEGKTAWFLFTKPVKPLGFVTQKIVSAIFISTPILVFSLIYGYLFKLSFVHLFSTLVILFLTGFLGNIHPNFRDGDNPERVSTSLMGLTALLISLLIIFLFTRAGLFNFATVFSLISIIIFGSCGVLSVRRYRF